MYIQSVHGYYAHTVANFSIEILMQLLRLIIDINSLKGEFQLTKGKTFSFV